MLLLLVLLLLLLLSVLVLLMKVLKLLLQQHLVMPLQLVQLHMAQINRVLRVPMCWFLVCNLH